MTLLLRRYQGGASFSNGAGLDFLQFGIVGHPLTGLFNRRYLEETLIREVRRACRQGSALSMLTLDLDHFKQLNDIDGHDAGDVMQSVISCARISGNPVEGKTATAAKA
jgi:hypothetical protein